MGHVPPHPAPLQVYGAQLTCCWGGQVVASPVQYDASVASFAPESQLGAPHW